MKKPIKVVMLPTEDNVVSVSINRYINETHNRSNLIYESKPLSLSNKDAKECGFDYQHIYITVSQDVEPIKEGDWCYNELQSEVIQWSTSNRLLTIGKKMYIKESLSKIIATTDPKLTLKSIPSKEYRNVRDVVNGVPQVQQSFLKEFVANPNGEWEVEYYCAGHEEIPPELWCQLKLNQDNTINITSITNLGLFEPSRMEFKPLLDKTISIEEKMYSKEEMYLSAANVVNQIATNRGNSNWNMKVTPKMIVDDWIKENL